MPASIQPSPAFGRRTAIPQDTTGETHAPGARRAAVLAIAAGLAIGGCAVLLRRAPAPQPRDVDVTLGGVALRLPSPLLRAGDVRTRDQAGRIDLALRWPDLGPAAPPVPDKAVQARLGDVLLVTLTPMEPGETTDRLSGLYARFLDPAVRSGPNGLLERRFRPGSPYETQELLFSPPDGRRFLAMCDARPGPGEVLRPLCTARFLRDGLAVQVRFEPPLAQEWDRMEATLLPHIASWRRTPVP